jgi:transcriptional regulator with XRE-family HTH domain
MILTMGEKIRIILNRKDMAIADLADLLGQSRQNFTNKLNRDNFSEKELHEIAQALNMQFHGEFEFSDTGERI